MTAQISDRVIYNNHTFSIAGVNGEGLFDPKDYEIKVEFLSSACWRGFHCTYEIADKSLRLQDVYIGLTYLDEKRIQLGKGIKLFGKVPTCYKESDYRYEHLNQLIMFTGGILIGSDFIREMYVHMGFHKAYKFREVYELVFESGQLIKTTDCSQKMSNFRNMLIDKKLQPDLSQGREQIEQWIGECFSLDYKL